MIRAILWDVDGTLLNFHTAERQAFSDCFARFGLGPCTEELRARFSHINDRWWKALERGEVSRAQLLTGRFEAFFRAEGIPLPDCVALNDYYQIRLGDTVEFEPGAYALVRDLAGRVRQYAVTNGTRAAQRRKLAKAGLDSLFDGVFISEEVGAEKPDPGFFAPALRLLGDIPREEILIVGDSLTSDMKGGQAVGIRRCWYDPQGRSAPEELGIHWHIQELEALRPLLEAELGQL